MRIQSEGLMLRVPAFAGVIALALGVLSPQVARAQQTFFACYVPDVGAIYMIKLTGLPVNCLAPTHVEISWSAAVGDSHSLDAADGSPTDALFVDNDGKVGIGTTAPANALHVVGGAGAFTSLADGVHIGEDAVGSTHIELVDGNGQVPYIDFLQSNTGDFDARISLQSGRLAVVSVGELSLQAGADLLLGNLSGTNVILKQNGNVGIGTTTPADKLDVVGNVRGDRFSDRNNTTFFIDPASTGVAGTFNGRVGIGTHTPGSQLTVAGTVESTLGGFKFPDGTVQATAATGGSSGGGQIHCAENDNCQGQVVACWFRGDDSDGGLGRIRFDEPAFPIQFGPWSNAQCGTSGNGWHINGIGTCMSATGSGSKGCQAVIVLN